MGTAGEQDGRGQRGEPKQQQQQQQQVARLGHSKQITASSYLVVGSSTSLFALAGLLLLLLISSSTQFAKGQQQQQQQPAGPPPPPVGQPASINLNAILAHQQALARECQQFEASRLAQLRQAAAAIAGQDQAGGANEPPDQARYHLGGPMALKVPAVCLFLFGPPGSLDVRYAPTSTGDSAAESTPDSQQQQLDLVNWIYDLGDLLQESGGGHQKRADNMTKRTVGPLEGPAGAELENPLSEYLFDPNKAAASAENSVETDQLQQKQQQAKMRQFHRQVDQLLGDERFHEAVDKSKGNLLAGYLSPVVLVPGLLGSRLQARVSKGSRVNIFCSKQSDWQDMWLSLRVFLPIAVDCWLDNVRLEPDPGTGFSRPPAGVEARVPDFGSVESVRHLDLRSPKMTKYFETLIERYERLGYVPDRNLFAAPYDFRLAPQELATSWFPDLRQLIERAQQTAAGGAHAAAAASRSKVTLVCHSMGCTHLLIFLRQQTAEWRQARVRKVIALSSPWAGTMKALKALVVGDQLDLPLISEAKMRRLARTYPSIAYLLPQEEVFARPTKNGVDYGGPTLVSVLAGNKQYKVGQMDQLLRELNLTQQLEWFQRAGSLIKPLEPLPDVQVDCIHSLNIPTPETLIFRNATDFPDGPYELVQGEGDGTVNHQSLLVCADWAKRLPDKVKHIVIMNTNHLGVLSHPTTLTHLTDDVLMN